MAIATGNIKVNGKWYKAGEEYEPEVKQVQIPVASEQSEEKPEEPKAEARTTAKPRTTRRKVK